ncbi:MAG: hypothetical protein V7745_00590 [Pseudomonadales bacterium]
MIIDYKEVDTLEQISEDACQEIPADGCRENYILPFQISRQNLLSNKLADVEEDAAHWAAEECPEHLFFSHGQFRKGGLQHVSDELNQKRTSNRALYSLINQKNITDSGDDPIPSFMVFQCLLDEHSDVLFVSVYFRALEVSSFLRINLEEIRQNLVNLYEKNVNFDRVKLLITAGRAHHTPGQLSLERPKIDLFTQLKLYKMLKESPAEIRELLIEKASAQSVISYKSLELLKECLEEVNCSQLKINDLQKAIDVSIQLQLYRQQGSHSNRVSELTKELKETLESLAERFVNG